jgi:hypothetical protein
MRISKAIVIVVAVMTVALVAWASDDDGVKSRSDDKGGLRSSSIVDDHGRGRDDSGRGGAHQSGGQVWRGHHDEWRHRHYSGSWNFLWHRGPVIFSAPVSPQGNRMPRHEVGVYVRHTGGDYVGSQFANSVREHLRKQGLKSVNSAEDAGLELYVVSMEQDPDEAGYGSSISVSYVWYPGHRFITAQMLDAGIDEVGDLALSVAGYAGELVDQHR